MLRRGEGGGARIAFGVALGCALSLSGFSFEAQAQKTAEVGKADALFNAGRSLLEAGEYADACPKFAESQKLAPGLGVTLYLADCYERLGRTASALAEFRRAVQIAAVRGDKRGAIAGERANGLEARVPQLVIVVTPAARAQELTVTLDGEVVPSTQWDAPAARDPGDHDIVVSAPSKATRHLNVKLVAQKGVVTTMVEPLEDPALPLPESSRASDPLPPLIAPASKTQKWIGVAVGGVGVLGLGAGAVLGVLAMSKLNDSNNGPCNASDHCSTAGLGLRQDAEHFGNASTAAFIAGGVALAGGVVLFLTAPKSGGARVGLEIDPILSPDVLGLRARSSF
jgi:hypothetical protein